MPQKLFKGRNFELSKIHVQVILSLLYSLLGVAFASFVVIICLKRSLVGLLVCDLLSPVGISTLPANL